MTSPVSLAQGLEVRRLAAMLLRACADRKVTVDEAVSGSRDAQALASRDRALLSTLLLTTFRHRGEIDTILARFVDRPLPRKCGTTREILVLGVSQLLFLGMAPHAVIDLAVRTAKEDRFALHFAGLINAVLRKVSNGGVALREGLDAPRLNTPPWLWDRWVKTYGEETTRQIALAHGERPALDVAFKSDAAPWMEALGGVLLPNGQLRLSSDHEAVPELAGFAEGAWWIQDAAATIPARLLGDVRGRAVLDLCAAPGGKTLQLAAAGAQVTAVDMSELRLVRVEENLRRTGLEATLLAQDMLSSDLAGEWDAVLLDAPCSATGTIRRHPELPYLKDEAQVRELAGLQRRMLRKAAGLVRPGGILVYCTCSLEPEEGEMRARGFLADQPEFEIVPAEGRWLPEGAAQPEGWVRTLPCMSYGSSRGMDGFFAVAIRRRPELVPALESAMRAAGETPSEAPMSEPVSRALLSVSDKTGLIPFARKLVSLGIELISTGGTAKTLAEAGLPVTEVSSVTGFPEIMDGRVKTLHPAIHGGLLGIRANAEHTAAMASHGIRPIGLLVVNLYPFEATVARGASWQDTVENIDVGGPAMIRAAAKNHDDVTVIVDPSDYDGVAAELSAGKTTTVSTRRHLASKAFARTASYDAAISQWFGSQSGEPFGGYFATGGAKLQALRYGENPHQTAAFYASPGRAFGISAARQLQGKELSYNNINDTDAALECLSEFTGGTQAACVIVKHANPCGVAVGASMVDAYRKALACDPVSAFGGIIALSEPLDAATATVITELFTEVIIAPYADERAIEIVSRKKNLRLLLLEGRPISGSGLSVKSVGGGLLVQTRDTMSVDAMDLKVVTKRQPTASELADLGFAFRVAKHVKSNAIVYAKDGATVGIGAGQMSRVDSARIAARKNEDVSREAGLERPSILGSVVASDAFFPFPDGLLQAAEAGATAVIQPGGSMKDDEVIRVADEEGLAMVFTGIRHFRH